jgi:hypothetical protein
MRSDGQNFEAALRHGRRSASACHLSDDEA